MKSFSIDFIVDNYTIMNEILGDIVQLAHNRFMNINTPQTRSILRKMILITKTNCLMNLHSHSLGYILHQRCALCIVLFFLFSLSLSYLQCILLLVFIKCHNFCIAIFFFDEYNGARTKRIFEVALCGSDICFD